MTLEDERPPHATPSNATVPTKGVTFIPDAQPDDVPVEQSSYNPNNQAVANDGRSTFEVE